MPATVINTVGWWIVSSEKDWLLSGGSVDLTPFSQITRAPEIGLNAMRAETIIAALAMVVITAGSDGLSWIVGDKTSLPTEIEQLCEDIGQGRLVAFKVEEA